MATKKEIVDIRLRLKGEGKEKFLRIKRAKGLTNNTEVLRALIQEYPEEA